MERGIKFTPALRKMLSRISEHSGTILEVSVSASGGREYTKLQTLMKAKYVIRVDHPTVKDRMGYPADVLAITDAGKAALTCEHKRDGGE